MQQYYAQVELLIEPFIRYTKVMPISNVVIVEVWPVYLIIYVGGYALDDRGDKLMKGKGSRGNFMRGLYIVWLK